MLCGSGSLTTTLTTLAFGPGAESPLQQRARKEGAPASSADRYGRVERTGRKTVGRRRQGA